MSQTLFAAAVLAVTLALAPAGANAQTVANGTYYATPSWNLTLPVHTRFIVLANFNQEAVLDRETGLVWERRPASVEANWAEAHEQCMSRKIGGRSGWRLPSIHELGSLLGSTGDTLPVGHPFEVSQTDYWSDTSSPRAPDLVMVRGFVDPLGLAASSKGLLSVYWCVRGGRGDGQ